MSYTEPTYFFKKCTITCVWNWKIAPVQNRRQQVRLQKLAVLVLVLVPRSHKCERIMCLMTQPTPIVVECVTVYLLVLPVLGSPCKGRVFTDRNFYIPQQVK